MSFFLDYTAKEYWVLYKHQKMSQYALGGDTDHRYILRHSHNPVVTIFISLLRTKKQSNLRNNLLRCLTFIPINYKVATRPGQYNLMENDFLRCQNFINNKTSNLAKQLHLNNKLSDCKQL